MTNTGINIGYVRVSTDAQSTDLQLDALKKAGIEKVFSDEGISGTKASRPGLDEALAYLRPGDCLVIYSLSRLGRNTRNVLALLDDLAERGIAFRSLTEGISTEGSMGKLMTTILLAFAQLERDVLVERTNAGLAASRARGRSGGRPTKLTPAQHKMIRSLYESNTIPIAAIAEQFKVHEQTIFRSLRSTREAVTA